jgi:hypothetical protein
MVDEDLADTTFVDLQNGTRNHGVAGEREHVVNDRAPTERPPLNGVGCSESVDDLHEMPLSRTNRHRDLADSR